jgi:hypothetical protein
MAESGWSCAIGLWELFDRCIGGSGLEEAKSGVEHLVLALDVMGRTHRPAHQVRHDQRPRALHLPCPVGERLRDDRNRRDPGFLDRPRYVSDRHVAHGSDGDEEHHIDIVGVDTFHPAGEFPAELAVGCRSWERVERRSKRPDPAILVRLA